MGQSLYDSDKDRQDADVTKSVQFGVMQGIHDATGPRDRSLIAPTIVWCKHRVTISLLPEIEFTGKSVYWLIASP